MSEAAITKEQLKKAYEWAERNEDDNDVAKAYLMVCMVIGSCCPEEVNCDHLNKTDENICDELFMVLGDMTESMFCYRDKIAALINLSAGYES